MNRIEFEELRNLPGKIIRDDIVFNVTSATGSQTKVVGPLRVENSLGIDLFLNGAYRPWEDGVTYNFAVDKVGPICRVDVNGTNHQTQGRTHKHSLTKETDPKNNLPEAVARPELSSMTAKQVWDVLCKEANIIHEGSFFDPEGAL